MKLKLDENLPIEILPELRQAGHEADSVYDEGIAGAPDPIVLATAKKEGRVLFTMDKGIGDIRAYRSEEYLGIVLFRPPASGRSTALAFVAPPRPAEPGPHRPARRCDPHRYPDSLRALP